MNLIKLRSFARAGLALASLSIIAGGAITYFGFYDFGDVLMIFGAALLIISAFALARTPTGDKDALPGIRTDAE